MEATSELWSIRLRANEAPDHWKSVHVPLLPSDGLQRDPGVRAYPFWRTPLICINSMAIHPLIDLLRNAAAAAPAKELVFHEETTTSSITYVVWFWSIIAAGAIPVVSTPLSADAATRDHHLKHLKKMLANPLVLTTNILKGDLGLFHDLGIASIEELTTIGESISGHVAFEGKGGIQEYTQANDVAFMMLTSGSTGGAKAVEMTHDQVFSALEGKSQTLETNLDDVFLNWIGFDHVACVTEVHLHAMYICAKQVHMDSKIPVQSPVLWLNHLAAHSVSITFAPNFFLAAVVKLAGQSTHLEADLSSLRYVVSGGEANVTSTAIAFNNIAKKLDAKHNVVCPAFGMTETCAGSIYNLDFPGIETRAGLEFCSVGQSTKSIEWQIVDDNGSMCAAYHKGALQLRGAAVFRSYYNDTENTEGSFVRGGWFKTGDIGYMDTDNNLILVGRSKDSIILNGVKYFSHELEAAVEEAAADHLIPTYTAAFPVWSKPNNTEEVVVTFVPSREPYTDEHLSAMLDRIGTTIFLHCSMKPRAIVPLSRDLIHKSSLGKLSRSSIKRAFENGQLDQQDQEVKKRISDYRRRMREPPETNVEKILAEAFADEFTLDVQSVGIDASLVEMGIDSVRLLRFKSRLQEKLGLKQEIPVGVLLTNPTIRGLAQVLTSEDRAQTYDPVIVLQSGKSQAAPIWFIHPGLGEVLVFLNISRYFSDREVYALRAPGFNPGEKMFESIDEMTDLYMREIRHHQPSGPYVLIGYSFGSMIAFETSKKLEAVGQNAFMGSLNGPPHIKWRMVQIDWCELFLNLSYFLGFLTEEEAVEKSKEFRQAKYTKKEILEKILCMVSPEKLAELDLNEEKLVHWADISSQLQGLAHNYDPKGKVQHIDVFYANPLLAVGQDKQKWLREHLHAWNDFSQEDVRFHDSPGAHYTMLDPDHVFVMQKVVRAALRARGI
ncbi:nonribosomal peptide synthetase [Seiridium cupressi]